MVSVPAAVAEYHRPVAVVLGADLAGMSSRRSREMGVHGGVNVCEMAGCTIGGVGCVGAATPSDEQQVARWQQLGDAQDDVVVGRVELVIALTHLQIHVVANCKATQPGSVAAGAHRRVAKGIAVLGDEQVATSKHPSLLDGLHAVK